MLNCFRNIAIVVALSITFATSAFATDFYITASSVEDLNESLTSVSPSVDDPTDAEDYLDSSSCLGYNGPVGPYGPLGILGPVGSNTWNVSYWMSGAYDWSDWDDEIDGPLSEAGPLGSSGPLSDDAYYTDLPAINDFAKQLQAGGVWTVLGPVGPLGPLGALGPVGPIGAHGYSTDYDGSYIENSTEMRTVDVDYEGSSRTYELYENYTESYAKSKTDNDTSFMVEGYISYPYTETDTYEFESGSAQFVTIAVVGEYTLDDFDLTITDEYGTEIATSNTYDFTDWVQLEVPANTTLKAEVTLYSTYHIYTKDYRLFVTGSSEYISTTDITGDHQIDQ